MSEQKIDGGVFGFTDDQGSKHTIVITAQATGEVDSGGRHEWVYEVSELIVEPDGNVNEPGTWEGTVHWHPSHGTYGLLSRIFGAVHLKLIEQEADEYTARKNANNND